MRLRFEDSYLLIFCSRHQQEVQSTALACCSAPRYTLSSVKGDQSTFIPRTLIIHFGRRKKTFISQAKAFILQSLVFIALVVDNRDHFSHVVPLSQDSVSSLRVQRKTSAMLILEHKTQTLSTKNCASSFFFFAVEIS